MQKQKKKGGRKLKIKKNKSIKTTIITIIIIAIILILLTTIALIVFITKHQKTNSLEAQNEKSIANTQETRENNKAKQQIKEYTEEHVNKVQDASGDTLPVPKGYVGSKVTGENEIDTGGEINMIER